MRKIVFLCQVLSLIFIFNSSFAAEEKYFCPMHPHYIATEPGSCPICGMTLVLREEEAADDSVSAQTSSSELAEGS